MDNAAVEVLAEHVKVVLDILLRALLSARKCPGWKVPKSQDGEGA